MVYVSKNGFENNFLINTITNSSYSYIICCCILCVNSVLDRALDIQKHKSGLVVQKIPPIYRKPCCMIFVVRATAYLT